MTTLLEYYTENHKFNSLLTVLLKYIDLFLMTLNLKNLDYLFTKRCHNAGIIIPCIMLKVIAA